jgi:hypothetical protein
MFLRRNNISINHRFMRRSCICKGVVKGQLGKLVDVPSVRQYIYWWLIADCCYINWLIRLWLIVHCYLVSISLYIQCNRTYLKLLEMIVTGSDCRNDFPWWCDWLWGLGPSGHVAVRAIVGRRLSLKLISSVLASTHPTPSSTKLKGCLHICLIR